VPTPAAREAERIARDEEGLVLETTYTAKAMAALIERVRSGRALFWLTYDGRRGGKGGDGPPARRV
jgi:hypothetical protein